MKRVLLALGLAAMLATGAATAHEIKHKSIKIVHPWVFETEGPRAVLRATLKNSGEAAERLLRGSTPLADKVSIVDAKGKPLSGVTIPPRGELALKSDGMQIVLSGLKKPLRAYDSFDVMLVFEKAGPVTVEVLVEEATETDQPGTGG
jgi:periplasmic copper chaperone A